LSIPSITLVRLVTLVGPSGSGLPLFVLRMVWDTVSLTAKTMVESQLSMTVSEGDF
jgi:hypothetical protein